MTLHIAGGVKIVMKDCRKISKFLHRNFFLTQICLFWPNSARNDENKNFRKNQNFDPPNFWTPLIFQNLKDHVTLHPCTKFGNSRFKGLGARGHKAEKRNCALRAQFWPVGVVTYRAGAPYHCAHTLKVSCLSDESFDRLLWDHFL